MVFWFNHMSRSRSWSVFGVRSRSGSWSDSVSDSWSRGWSRSWARGGFRVISGSVSWSGGV